MNKLGIRWTVGNVNRRGFEALRLSVWGMWNLLGDSARYVICLNQVEAAVAKSWTGVLPEPVEWMSVECGDIPAVIRSHLDGGMAEGVGWKFAPIRLFPESYELSLDNDCILWKLPPAIRSWLESGDSSLCVVAEDVRPCFGQFAPVCRPEPRNSGIRGLSPGFDYLNALEKILRKHPTTLRSELDEQGLQTAALQHFSNPLAVTSTEVTICSPFWPHSPDLGECGAHFVGLNAHHLGWSYYDRPADEWMSEHWTKHRPAICQRLGISPS